MVRALVYYTSGAANAEQALAFMQSHGFVERFYMLVGNAFNYASVFFCWIVLKKKSYIPKFGALWLSLIATAIYFFTASWALWAPIAAGAQMSDSFALGFVKITLYANVIGLICAMLGYAIGNYVKQQNILSKL